MRIVLILEYPELLIKFYVGMIYKFKYNNVFHQMTIVYPHDASIFKFYIVISKVNVFVNKLNDGKFVILRR